MEGKQGRNNNWDHVPVIRYDGPLSPTGQPVVPQIPAAPQPPAQHQHESGAERLAVVSMLVVLLGLDIVSGAQLATDKIVPAAAANYSIGAALVRIVWRLVRRWWP